MKVVRESSFLRSLALSSAIGVLGTLGCHDSSTLGERLSPTGGTGGAVSSQAGEHAEGGASGAGGTVASPDPQCPSETPISAPSLSKDCAISPRNIDPLFTCGQANCAVRLALDLTCKTLPGSPRLSATTSKTSLFTVTQDSDNYAATAHLMTVTATGSQIEDLSALNSGTLSWYSLAKSAMSSSSSGKRWVFTGGPRSLTADYETDNGWVRSGIPIVQNSGPYLDARMVDDNTGYLTYAVDVESYAPHLVTWDGSCWTDRTIANRGRPSFTVLAVDEKKQPWVAWFDGDDSLYLRSPDGDTEDLLSNLTADTPALTVAAPLRLLPGGLDGTTSFPLVAAGTSAGYRLFC